MSLSGATIDGRIVGRARLRPDDVALRSRTIEFSYEDLDRHASALSVHLRARAGATDIVAVCMERSPRLVIAMLAILKAGGACLPLDWRLPPARLSSILRDSGCALAITADDDPSILDDSVATLAISESGIPRVRDGGAPPPAPVVDADRVAMVLYTSGSTGQPKGVVLTHRNVLALLDADERLRHHVGDVVAQVLSPSFDAVLLDVWGALVNGATVFLPPVVAATSAGHLIDELEGQEITTLPITSSLMHQLAHLRPQFLGRFRNVWFGGEAADLEVLRRLPPGPRFTHHYGPTECTSISTVHGVDMLLDDLNPLPIGCELAGLEIRLVDADLMPVEDGDIGEICIGGPQVASGYLNDPMLTAARFIRLPGDAGAQPFYRSGDLARRLPNGELQFLGREDEQVKIRGFRVELSEVEAALRQGDGVTDAAVIARGAASELKLIGYVTPISLNSQEIVTGLTARLPEYMIPSAIVCLAELPKSSTNKVDKQSLPVPQVAKPTVAALDSPIEERLAALWSEILDVEHVAADDDFFAIGGYSLLAARLVLRIEDEFGEVVPLRALFEARTIRELARLIPPEQG